MRVLSGELSVGGRFGPLWPLNGSDAGFAAHIETEPKAQLKLLLEADAEGMALLPAARAGDTRFARLRAIGPEIDPGRTHLLEIDLACRVTDAAEFTDTDGIYALEWTLEAVHDEGWGRALSARLVNALSGF